MIQYSGDLSKPVKVLVEANGDKNVYSIPNNTPNFVPLQMGEGTYKISVLRQIEGTRFKPLKSESIEVGKVDVNKMYTSPHLLVNYDASMKAIQGYAALIGEKNKNDMIKDVYKEMVTNYTYDFDKIKNLPSDYVPVIDEIYASRKAICYDYTVMLARLLWFSGVPTKLIMGYAPEIKEYHAWNEILMDGKWVTVDTTYDSQYDKAGASYTFEKDAAARTVVKVY
jgi:transglutaminase/protease-like cytokinesis protein 3